jgi:hypothetical protein
LLDAALGCNLDSNFKHTFLTSNELTRARDWWNDAIRDSVLLVQRGGNEEEMEWDMGIGTWCLRRGHVDEVLGS